MLNHDFFSFSKKETVPSFAQKTKNKNDFKSISLYNLTEFHKIWNFINFGLYIHQ